MRNIAQRCSATRELVSLELDGELTELDAARLAAHLEGCASCRELKAELGGLTAALRATPLEPLSRPIALPQRVRVFLRPLQVGAVAATIAVVAGVAGIVGTLHSGGPAQRVPSVQTGEGLDALRAARRPLLLKSARRVVPQAAPTVFSGSRRPAV
jgi:predicted anti-sigma-YlaC factor YlaD